MGDGALVAWDMGPIIAYDGPGGSHYSGPVAEALSASASAMSERATMSGMSDVVNRASDLPASRPARVLLYSDDRNVREKVMFAVGGSTHGRPVVWTETATYDAVISQLDGAEFDLVILDGEAAKYGGMGICRQMKHELYKCPPVLLLVGRPGDAWLATWSEADAAVSHPLDPFVVREAVDEFFAPAHVAP